MPESTLQRPDVAPPLVALSEDEVLFRDNVRQFAEEKIRPLVREMDEIPEGRSMRGRGFFRRFGE